MEVRVAALDAFRRLPCQFEIQTPILEVYKDTMQDSELRIAAYLALMKCPTPSVVDSVREALEAEPVNQGMDSSSFVVSCQKY